MWWRRRDADDFADEVASHLEHEEARLRAAGMSPDAARREARRVFGNPTRSVERVRDAAQWRLASTLWQDARYALRLMRRAPGFTATAILVLSLGIGVNTALFSIVNALFFTPLPVERPEELVYFYTVNEAGQVMPELLGPSLEVVTERGAELLEFSSHMRTRQPLTIDDETEVTTGYLIHHSYSELLGASPALGRGLLASDDLASPEKVMVISHDLWVRRFDSRPDVLGTEVRVQSDFFQIVGVMPEGFVGLSSPLEPAEYWVTYTQARNRPRDDYRSGPIARMKPGVTFEQVRAFLAAQVPEMKARAKERLASITDVARRERLLATTDRTSFEVHRATDVVDPFEPRDRLLPPGMLAGLTSVVGLVLLIATANIAGLLLARGVTRTGELAVRRALGAGGVRLSRQLLVESVVLACAGGVLGLGLAWNLVALFSSTVPERLAFDVTLDWRVLVFAAVACVATGVVVGLAPALQALRVNVLDALGGGIVGSRTARGSIRRWVVIPQIGLSFVLLLVAAVHVRSLLDIEEASTGYQTTDGMVVQIGRWEPRPSSLTGPRMTVAERQQWNEEEARRVREFNRNVLDRVGALPNVSRAAIAASLPLRASLSQLASIMAKSDYDTGGRASASAWRSVVSHDYFEVMDMTLLAGRAFDDRDSLYRSKVALVSASLQQVLGRNLIGESIGFVETQQGRDVEWLEVIGVVNDVLPVLQDQPARPRVYVPLLQQWRGSALYLLVQGAGDRQALARDVKRAVVASDTYAEVYGVQAMTQVVDEILYPRRLAAGILATAGLIGLTLASIGLYGVVSFSVARRRREIGIRATLGASRRDILALILREGVVVAAIGCAAGLALGVLALRLTAGLIPDLPTVDVLAFVGVPAALTLVVLAACYIPARRAARVDPADVLRSL